MIRGASLISGLDIDKITQILCFRFMEENVSSRYHFALSALYDLQPVERFVCTSDI